MNDFHKYFKNTKLSDFHHKTNWHGMVNFCVTLSCIIIILYFLRTEENVFLFITTFIVIGALQHRLSIFLHECLHFSLFKSKFLNTSLGKISAYLIFFKWKYRKVHLMHHKHLGHENDPDLNNYIHYPTGFKFFLTDLFHNLLGIAACTQFFKQSLNFNKTDTQSNSPSETIPSKSSITIG